jgi:hypothetical protein
MLASVDAGRAIKGGVSANRAAGAAADDARRKGFARQQRVEGQRQTSAIAAAKATEDARRAKWSADRRVEAGKTMSHGLLALPKGTQASILSSAAAGAYVDAVAHSGTTRGLTDRMATGMAQKMSSGKAGTESLMINPKVAMAAYGTIRGELDVRITDMNKMIAQREAASGGKVDQELRHDRSMLIAERGIAEKRQQDAKTQINATATRYLGRGAS